MCVVIDYSPTKIHNHKIKEKSSLTIDPKENPDVAK